MKPVLIIISIFLISFEAAYSQGCVAIRSGGAVCTRHDESMENHNGWRLNMGYRYFKSFRHFVGKEEQKHRVEKQTDVRNWQNSLDISLARNLNSRWSVAVNLPVIANTRSSLYEHGGKERLSTHSFGLGDVRITVNRWLLNTQKNSKGNIQLGLGIKLPTGDYQYQDFFKKTDSTELPGPVDQSIQLGDGGTGFTVEVNGYYNVSRKLSVYGNLFYLVNPREQNGVSTARGSAPSATSMLYQSSTMSVPDQYMVRGGANLSFKKLTLSGGIRMEGVPAIDLIGGSNGFRRPGYVISYEPGISWQFKKVNAFATVPVAFSRNRTQSVPDKIRTQKTGIRAQGDAAFADYSLNAGIAIVF